MGSKSPLMARLGGDLVKAGDLYYEQGQLIKAAEMYLRAGRRLQAARVWVEAGDVDKAVAIYLEDGEPRKAGELLAQQGDHKRAVQHFATAGAHWAAAESCLKLKQPARAARFFEQASAWSRAARAYEAAGEVEPALEAWKKESERLDEELRAGGEIGLKDQRRQIDLRRAEQLVRLSRAREAADLLAQWDYPARAAELYLRAGDAAEAARLFFQAKQPERAAELLPQAEKLDAETRGWICFQVERYREAADLFLEAGRREEAAQASENAGDWQRAAEIWEKLGNPARAADLFYRAESWAAAGRLYLQAGSPEMAAETFAKGGLHAAAAGAFARSDQLLKAALQHFKAGQKEKAQDLLQEIPPDHPEFPQATSLLVKVLVEKGLYEGARARLEMLPEDPQATGRRTLDRLYWEGRIFEGLEDYAKAEQKYQRAFALSRNFRDVTQRLQQVREKAREEQERLRSSQAAGTGTGTGVVTGTGTASGPLGSGRMSPGVFSGHLSEGEVLEDRWEILGELGRGGMSRVYKARDRVLDDLVAIKMLIPSAGEDEQRLVQEVSITRRINHPNIVRVFDIGRFPGGVFVTMELLEGVDLDRIIRRPQRLSLTRVKAVLLEVVKGLDAAHRLKVIHRDLKPRNLILTRDRLKILDFGIARMEGKDLSLTGAGQVLGSPLYMSPEQVRGDELDARSDLYSLGVLTFALLAGREPFLARTAEAVAYKQVHETPPDILELRPEIPPAWKGFMERLLRKDREERYASAEEVLTVLKALPAEDEVVPASL